jgi:hypothetical protein
MSGDIVGGYINFIVPRSSTSELVPFFRKLEFAKQSLGIKDLQLSLTTLEEVFLNIAEHSELKSIQGNIIPSNSEVHKAESFNEVDQKDIERDRYLSIEREKPKKRISRKDQLKALLVKTATLQKRDKKTLACQVLTPLALCALLFGFQILIRYLMDPQPIPESRTGTLFAPFQILTQPEGIFVESDLANLAANGVTFFYAISDPTLETKIGTYGFNGSGILGEIDDPSFGSTFPFKFIQTPSGIPTDSNATYYSQPSLPFRVRFELANGQTGMEDGVDQ